MLLLLLLLVPVVVVLLLVPAGVPGKAVARRAATTWASCWHNTSARQPDDDPT
jgi:hypothetical protein